MSLNERFAGNLVLPLIILIEGFASIAVEILTIRQLLPVAGSNVVVTSLIIGIFLLFLAVGYWYGGRLTDNLRHRLSINFLLAATWIGVGLSYIFIINFFGLIEKFIGPHVIYPLLAYLLLIIAPLIFILGQTVPISMNLAKQNKSTGTIGGNTLGLSTAGSFLGATITSLLFMHYFGVAWTVYINFLVLLMLGLFLVDKKFLNMLLALFFSVAAMWVVAKINIDVEHNLFVRTNNYANYQILDHNNFKLADDERILAINNSYSSYINGAQQGFEYVEFIKSLLFTDLQLRNANILVLGAGGFTLSAEQTYENHFIYVDIDKQIKDVTEHFFLKKINGILIAEDARQFIHTNKQKFQAIVVDAFTNLRSIPPYLLTKEFMQELSDKLLKNGVAIFNIIAKPTLSDPYSKRIDNTIRSVFANCMAIPLHYVDRAANIIYVCNNTNNQFDHTIYTDNRNTSTTDSFEW